MDQAGIGDDIDRDDCPLDMYVDVQLQDRCVCLRVLEVSMMDVVLVLSSEVEVVLDRVQVVNSFTPSLAEKKKEKNDNYLNPIDEKSGGVYLTKRFETLRATGRSMLSFKRSPMGSWGHVQQAGERLGPVQIGLQSVPCLLAPGQARSQSGSEDRKFNSWMSCEGVSTVSLLHSPPCFVNEVTTYSTPP